MMNLHGHGLGPSEVGVELTMQRSSPSPMLGHVLGPREVG
jgi:hypothetical protein